MKRVEALLVPLLVLACAGGCSSPCHNFSFHQAFPGVFVGCRPRKQADFERLREAGIRSIISYESFTWHVGPERRRSERNRIVFINVPVFASPLGPTETSMQRALRVLDGTSLRPVYVHCLYGRDRTAMILGLYGVYYQEAAPEEVWDQMMRDGYNADWSMWGFKRYFWKHTHKPEWIHPHSSPDGASRDESPPPQSSK